jgi:hypothetical protein
MDQNTQTRLGWVFFCYLSEQDLCDPKNSLQGAMEKKWQKVQ